MSTRNRPPINGDVIRDARLELGLTQEQVQDECEKRGTKVWNLSRLENGEIRWPSPQVLPVLAAALGLKVRDLYEVAEVAA